MKIYRHSLCSKFSFYISDMEESVCNLNIADFTEPNNLLQLVDEYEQSLALIFNFQF